MYVIDDGAKPIKSKSVIKQILKEAKRNGDTDYLFVLLALNTGMRVSDILDLKVKHITKDHFNFIAGKQLKNKKTKRIRYEKKIKMLLQEEVIEKIKEYEFNSVYLFESPNAIKPITRQAIDKKLKKIKEALGLEQLSAHSLRKTYGYWHYKKNEDIEILRLIFRHSHSDITYRYIGMEQEKLDESRTSIVFV